MIKIDRKQIDWAKESLSVAFATARSPSGMKISTPAPTDLVLEKAVMLALNSMTMDLLNINDVAVPSDVKHLTGFGLPSEKTVG